jgi:16S rRNA (uracil1498-N3)-methyltransferase
MTRVRVPMAGVAAGEQVLPKETSRYLCRVLRLGRGDAIVVFDAATRLEADATIEAASADAARVRVSTPRPAPVVATADLVLVYALAKGDKIDAVVRDATELGATRLVLAQTERSVVKAQADRAASKKDRWKRIAEQAARQCGRADPPAIDDVHAWPDALERASSCAARFCLDPRAATPLGDPLAKAATAGASIAFAIGPEGGLSADEIEIAIGKGFLPASLGPFVLRTETVAAAVLGAVRVLSFSGAGAGAA